MPRLYACFVVVLVIVVVVGCGRRQAVTQPQHTQQNGSPSNQVDSEPVTNTNPTVPSSNITIPSAGDVQMVVFHSTDLDHWPVSASAPLAGDPKNLDSRKVIATIVDAVKHPDGRAQTRMIRSNRLAIVAKNGDIVTFGITSPGALIGCDITPHKSSKKLGKTLMAALPQAQVTRLSIVHPVKSVSYDKSGKSKQFDPGIVERNQVKLKELLRCYRPLTLQGNRHCSTSEVMARAKDYPEFLTVKLAKSDSINAIVMTNGAAWPPETYNTNTRIEQVKFDTITIFSEYDGLARFVFSDTKSGKCLLTDPVNSLRIVKESQGRNPRVYGPDLFEEVVSALTKP